jgi:hypothetical protein
MGNVSSREKKISSGKIHKGNRRVLKHKKRGKG